MTPAILTGLAVGDALGMPFEKGRGEIHPGLNGWDGRYRAGGNRAGGNWSRLPAGHWTDDTAMATALAESLVEKTHWDPADVAARYLAWARGLDKTTTHMGKTTKKAMDHLAAGKPWDLSGVLFNPGEEEKVGNGTAMRCAPLAYLFDPTKETTLPDGRVIATGQGEALYVCLVEDARITHCDLEAASASLAVGFAAEACLRRQGAAMTGARLLEQARQASLRGLPVVTTKVAEALDAAGQAFATTLPPADLIAKIGRNGNAIQTTATALYCAAYHLDDFGAGVRAAVDGGGDTDTRAAICGAVLGARHGLEGIPAEYLEGLHERARLQALDAALFARRGR